ncbi:MAG TPA: sensor histidine kinase [Propionibacteriaceae bacterium]|nr:sensor histidine kinase [Propionibacteriaceae bacterium]
MQRVPTRSVLVDSVVALVLGWMCWSAAAFDWGRDRDPVELGPGGPPGRRDGPPPWFLDRPEVADWVLLPVLITVAGLAVRRVWPRSAFVAVVIGVGGYVAAGASFPLVFLAPALVIYAMAMALPLRRWVPLTALLVPMIVAGHLSEPYLGLLDPRLYAGVVLGIALAIVPALFALLRRSRREGERVAREQDRRRYAYEERMRIARDVHDVVGHSLSVITMQAGVALHVLDRRPDQVAASLEAIRTTSREALAELRTTLEVFRDPDGGEPRAPLPGLARLDDLVGALRQAGRMVEVVREGAVMPLPAAVDQAAFRIIQEALTNVVRHAEQATAVVRVSQEPGRLVVEVSDDGPAAAVPAAGNGIHGMGERARAVGGTLEVLPRAGGGLVVRAVLPLGEEAP